MVMTVRETPSTVTGPLTTVWRRISGGGAITGEEGVLFRGEGEEFAGGLYDTANEVAGDAAGQGKGALQVDGIARAELAQTGAAIRLRHALKV